MPQANAERQKRFRQLTLRERQLKADAFDLLLAFVDCDAVEKEEFSLPDGRTLKLKRFNGEVTVGIADNPEMQLEIKRARYHLLQEDR